MAVAIITVTGGASGTTQTNDQRVQRFYGSLSLGPVASTYVPGGIPLDSVLQATLLPTSNSGPFRVTLMSKSGSGYIYQRIAATGKMMILQVPLTGSLTTAAPLVEMLAGTVVPNESIDFVAEYLRNSS
jgi:hypothetical protein